MNENNTNRLFNEFPTFFRGREDIHNSLMGFGFECDDGWFDIIHRLCTDIKAVCDRAGWDGFRVVQVKEKWGGLRFYTDGLPVDIADEIDVLISKAESDSYTICEVCGNTGQLRKGGWWRTLCDDCDYRRKRT